MTDSPSDLAPAAAAVVTDSQDTPRAPSRRAAWPWVLLLIALGAGGLWFWDAQKRLAVAERSNSEWQQIADELRGRQLDVDQALDALRDRQRSIESRLTDSSTGQRVLREEVLGIGERAGLLEDALNRLADSRQEGAQAMLLDETEFLLLTGEERLSLFQDPGAAVRAFQLADAALTGVSDPVYAPLRQSLAQEVADLRAIPADIAPLIREKSRALIVALPTLPAPTTAEVRSSAGESRLMTMLSSLVTVRRLDDAGVPLDPLVRNAKIQALALQLELSLAELARGGVLAWQPYRESILAECARLFDQTDSRVASHVRSFEALVVAPAGPPPPIGVTLTELRKLRASRANRPVDAAPATVAPSIEAGPATAEPVNQPADVEAVE